MPDSERRARPRRPTPGELEILKVLWSRGPCTVREVREELAANGEPGYTTVLKLLQIMADKGLVRRDESRRAHVYAAAESEGSTQRRLLGDLLDRAFAGSTSRLVVQALSTSRPSRREIEEIRRWLDRLEDEREGER